MLPEVLQNVGWAVIFACVGAGIGVALVIVAAGFLPRMLERLTPQLDEEKEIARGNLAVADYFGKIVGASIIGISIVIAAAVLGGILAALH